MIYESIECSENLPFSVSFSNIKEESKHCHEELEIALVLRGTTNYQIYHSNYELSPGDLIIADVTDLHQIHNSSEDLLMVMLHVDTAAFSNIYPNISYMFFVCEECMAGFSAQDQELQGKLSLLKQSIASLTLDYLKAPENTTLLRNHINKVVEVLVNHFQGFFMEDYQYKVNPEKLSDVELSRLSSITRYLLMNYNQKVTLNDVSKIEHLNPYYVSHLIKKTLGFNFQNFLTAIRLEHGEKYLVFTNNTLLQIAEDCGFSSPNYFNKCFSAWYGKTPAQYRKDYTPCERTFSNDFSQEEALKLLSSYLNVTFSHSVLDLKFEEIENVDICPPSIFIGSDEDVFKLGYYKEKLTDLKISSFLLDKEKVSKDASKNLSSFSAPVHFIDSPSVILPGDTVAEAFKNISSSKEPIISLFGHSSSLFSEEGLPSCYFTAYSLIYSLSPENIKAYHNYLLLKGKDYIGSVVYNHNLSAILNVTLDNEALPGQYYLVTKQFSQYETNASRLANMGNPSFIPLPLYESLLDGSCGTSNFSLVNSGEKPTVNFIIYPGNTLFIKIIPIS